MAPLSRGVRVWLVLVCSCWAFAHSASGEVIGVTGSSTATVIQFDGILPVQSDFAQILVPLTKPEPPALSVAQVDRYSGEELTASGSVLSLFQQPNFAGIGVPNDVGMDLAAFAEDDGTSWFLRGEATETRTIIVRPQDAGTDTLSFGASNRARSRVILSGVMFITSREPTRNLTGAEVKLNVLVERRQFGRLPATLMEGEVVLGGGLNGTVSITRATGSFQGALLPIVDFSGVVSELPVVQAVLFAGVELPYEYPFDVNLPFELELKVSCEARTLPGGVGASAVFGLPQANMPTVMQKVARDDRGERLAGAIAGRVDTTGVAYEGGIGFLLPSLCGAAGIESFAIGLLCFGTAAFRIRRRVSRCAVRSKRGV